MAVGVTAAVVDDNGCDGGDSDSGGDGGGDVWQWV